MSYLYLYCPQVHQNKSNVLVCRIFTCIALRYTRTSRTCSCVVSLLVLPSGTPEQVERARVSYLYLYCPQVHQNKSNVLVCRIFTCIALRYTRTSRTSSCVVSLLVLPSGTPEQVERPRVSYLYLYCPQVHQNKSNVLVCRIFTCIALRYTRTSRTSSCVVSLLVLPSGTPEQVERPRVSYLYLYCPQVHQNKSNVLVCRICEKDHDSQLVLRNHMRQCHKACEMPYICHLCNFRSSVYSDVVDHFKKVRVWLLCFILGLTQEWFRELSFSRLECGVHDRLHIYPLCGISYFSWHKHQIEGTNGF